MARLVECVPNFSEGRRRDVVDALVAAVSGTPGVYLLDRTSDADHNRSVLTYAGEVEPVTTATQAAVEVALQRIDMNRHEGQHPRIGAVDVIPFVPLDETTIEEAVDLARRFGEQIATRYALPVFLYASAAARPDRVVLADIRRPQYEGLREAIGQPGGEPDYGPKRLHPTAGAVAVGARPFLIAWNVNLDTADVELAKRIARRVRERSGGLPRVQALGLWLEELGCAQVSMNLLDFAITPMWRVWDEVSRLATGEGVGVRESELIGLVPQAALLDAAQHAGAAPDLPVEERIRQGAQYLHIRDFTLDMALELRLAAATGPAV